LDTRLHESDGFSVFFWILQNTYSHCFLKFENTNFDTE
jgi:hypothetical protein